MYSARDLAFWLYIYIFVPIVEYPVAQI